MPETPGPPLAELLTSIVVVAAQLHQLTVKNPQLLDHERLYAEVRSIDAALLDVYEDAEGELRRPGE